MNPTELAESLGLTFNDPELLERAFVHRTASEEGAGKNNERLEYLGDAVLELAMTELLFRSLPDADEGQLSRIRGDFVSKPRLAACARGWQLGEGLRLGRGEEKSGGRDKDRLLANVFEALLGALYLDQGYAPCLGLVERGFGELIANVDDPGAHVHPKSRLQELSMERWKVLPRYSIVEMEGPAHDRRYTVRIDIGERVSAVGTDSKKKGAETAAAVAALEQLARAGEDES
ncbi:MAG: ribonuclease III [Proteobacteria bacterium]|nr:ribonuclease III [Pseudomonadota bacterium]MCP4915748.1 ribonuclease III [Pseudomonadota bacterium]